ncbi:hypothetical protein ABW21_db0205904 [Orbilia brochopaga]|nr:hypothetical protein ABW21_db0205904 [Drechslerella brochopaga]
MANSEVGSDFDDLFNDALLEAGETDMDHLFNEAALDEPAEANGIQAHALTFPTPPPPGALSFPSPPPPPLLFPTLAPQVVHHPLHFPSASPQAPSHLQFPSPPPTSATQHSVVRSGSPFSAHSPSADATSPESAASPSGEGSQARTKRKNKPRLNWTDEESERLLRGVNLYGIGSWAKIRADKRFVITPAPNSHFMHANFAVFSFGLEHRKGVDLKDRFRTLFPNEYRMHGQKPKTTTVTYTSMGMGRSPSPDVPTYTNGTSADNPVNLELDYEAAKLQKRLTRKRAARRIDSRTKVMPPPGLDPDQDPTLTTATGRRKVLRRHDVPWTPEEDADLPVAYRKYKRRFRLAANDRSLAFFGRSIADIQNRFVGLFPELNLTLGQEEEVEEPLNQFEQGLINAFGTTVEAQRQARRRAASAKLSHRNSLTPSTSAFPVQSGSAEGQRFSIGIHQHDASNEADATSSAQSLTNGAPELLPSISELLHFEPLGLPALYPTFASVDTNYPTLSLDVQGVHVDGTRDPPFVLGSPTPLSSVTTSNTSFGSNPASPALAETPNTQLSPGEISPLPATPGPAAGCFVGVRRPFDLPYVREPSQDLQSPPALYPPADTVNAMDSQVLGSPAAA